MAIEKIPCGGFSVDTTNLKFTDKVLKVLNDGATFTPSVSAEGVLSWTNDKELENPEPVDIKGDAIVVGNVLVANLDAGGYKITNLATPTLDTDSCTKKYADDTIYKNRLNDLFAIKSNSTVNISLPKAMNEAIFLFAPINAQGDAEVNNTKVITVAKGATGSNNDLSVDFNADGVTITVTSTNVNTLYGRYYTF